MKKKKPKENGLCRDCIEANKSIGKHAVWMCYPNIKAKCPLEEKEKPECFGKWLDLDLLGYPKCRTCEFLEECAECFVNSLEPIGNRKRG